MKKIILICSIFILISSCKSDKIQDIDNVDFKHKEMFKISLKTKDKIIENKTFNVLQDSLNSYNDYVNYYTKHGKTYLPSYHSGVDLEDIRIASIEYLMSLDSFLSKLQNDEITKLLCLVADKQKVKFSEKYISPERARETGLFLIIKLLSVLKDNDTLYSISNYCDKHTFEFKVYNDEDFNRFLSKTIEKKYSCNI